MERITKEDLKRRMETHELITLIDTRTTDAWDKSDVQLPGAIRVSPTEVDKHLQEIPRDQLVVTYCSDPDEHSSADVAQALLDAGWPDVRPLLGGFDAWRKAGFPLQAKVSEMLPRSVESELRARDVQANLEKAEGEEVEES